MKNKSDLLHRLEGIVGSSHLLTDARRTAHYRKGFRSGEGDALAVVIPATLLELWRVMQTLVEHDIIILMQAANTGLTEGSTPSGNDYDRQVVIINTLRLNKLQIINNGKQVVAFPGTTLYQLEKSLKPLNREPHSVIGSSCIGASVMGGVCNNSGGSLIKRGPAYSEMALYAQINERGELVLVNNLGIRLGDTPEEIFRRLDNGSWQDTDVFYNGQHASDYEYAERVRDVHADTPARYNADTRRLYEASGCAGKLAVFAVRLDTFPTEPEQQVFYIGTNDSATLTDIRRHILKKFNHLPVAGEYIHRDMFEVAEVYGKDTFIMIDWLGTDKLPLLFKLKARVDTWTAKSTLFKAYFSDRLLQKISRLFTSHLPRRMKQYRAKYEHHLMLKMSGEGTAEARDFLNTYFLDGDGAFFECTAKEGAHAFLHRFVAAGAAIRYQAVHDEEVEDILALDIALRRNDQEWFEKLPEDLSNSLSHRLYYGHFFCHVFHQDYIVKKGYDAHIIKKKMLELLDTRKAEYPAEHNVGHIYRASPQLVDFYNRLDPTNSFNPGIGKTSKLKGWAVRQ